jgi:hypothetical protein
MRDQAAADIEKLREECRALRYQVEASLRENRRLRAEMAEGLEQVCDATERAEVRAWSSSFYKVL